MIAVGPVGAIGAIGPVSPVGPVVAVVAIGPVEVIVKTSAIKRSQVLANLTADSFANGLVPSSLLKGTNGRQTRKSRRTDLCGRRKVLSTVGPIRHAKGGGAIAVSVENITSPVRMTRVARGGAAGMAAALGLISSNVLNVATDAPTRSRRFAARGRRGPTGQSLQVTVHVDVIATMSVGIARRSDDADVLLWRLGLIARRAVAVGTR